LNKLKRSLRSTLAALAASFADAVLAAARESLHELAASQSNAIAKPRPQRARMVRPSAKKARIARVEREPISAAAPAPDAASDLLITDPQALLAAFDTANPVSAYESPEPREEPEILRPAAVAVPARSFVPALRAGEELMRTSGSGIVLRRRRA
jgi:hypothetical protein